MSCFNTSGVGRLVADPELKAVGKSNKVAITLVNEEFYGGEEKKKKAHFLDFEAWDKAAELIAKYLKKGDYIHIIDASPRKDTWEADDGSKRSKTYFRIEKFRFINTGKRDNPVSTEEPTEPEVETSAPADDIPF